MLVDVARAVRRRRVEHRAEHAVLPGQRAERGDQLVAHARGEEAPEAALAVRQPERREAGAGELARAVDEPLQNLVDRQPRRDREHGVADRLQCRAEPLFHPRDDRTRGDAGRRVAFTKHKHSGVHRREGGRACGDTTARYLEIGRL